MIKIFKDGDTKVVTKGAYESLYKKMGYKVLIEKKEVIAHNLEEKTKSEEDKVNQETEKRNYKRK